MWLLLILLCSAVQEVTPLISDVPLSFSLDADIVHPVRVDEHGSFLTYDLTPRNLQKRGLSSSTGSSTYYEIKYKGVELTFNLSQNHQLLAPGFVSEWRNGGIRESRIVSRPSSSCHMQGEVQTHHQHVGNAAISICRGLRGVFQLEHEDFLIEPMTTVEPSLEQGIPHRIYRRHLVEDQQSGYSSCGVKEHPDSHDKWERRRERWEQSKARERIERLISRRSISKEKWVETLVVADSKMVEYHGKNSVENYVLTIMNMVAGLFHDASIGNRINIVVVRLILLESDEEELKVSHHADNSLRSFCKWQKAMNMKSEEHALHHDVAVLLTRRDICASMNRPCETLGLSHVSGMCQPHRSCNINEDTGLPTAFTVTHELGHGFGVQHDGVGNDCEPKGKRPHIMSPQLLYDTSPLTWSRCSRDYITRFLDRGWGLCLDDPPSKEFLDFPSVPPGVLYDVGHQCRLQYGSVSTFCQDIDNVCNSLWCSVGTTCHSKLDAAVDGTICGDNKWCFGGDCIPVGQRPSAVDGAWGSWSSWSSCTRSCGAGVQSAERHCSSPSPRYGGKYCLGERKRYRVCNVLPCTRGVPSFRHMQCSMFDSVPYKGKLHRWSPVSMNINPCELHCQSDTGYFAEKLRDAVFDGTPCFEGNTSRDMCINGICKNIGCDYEIDSNAVEDRCGVCHGDSSSCHTVHKTFDGSDGLGYVDIGLIPPGAREIQIEEVAEAGNFLALRSEDPERYFLNGRWTIQWNGNYKAAGTTFTYTRTGNLENLTAPGPTYEPVWIQLLFQEKNPGVRYQYTIRRDLDSSNEIQPPDFSWRYGSWSECSATCGTGVQRQLVHCVEKVAGLVEERYCDSLTRPDDRQRNCNEEPCPPRWWVGEWQQCSITCGTGGVQKRTVLCIQRVGLDEQRALLPADCQHLPKPESRITCNHREPCPAVWHHGNWSQCSVSCGDGFQYRDVYCDNNLEGGACNPSEWPISKRVCVMPLCIHGFDWTGSGGSSKEVFNEIFPGLPRSSNGNQHSLEDNSIFEGDFSNVGDGSQEKVGRAVVDDFYYDYNFINFHEDLSYDPVDDNFNEEEEELEPEYLPTRVTHLGTGNEEQGAENIRSTENPNSHFTTRSSENWKTSVNPDISTDVQTDVNVSDGTTTATKKSFLMEQYTTVSSDQERHTGHGSKHQDLLVPDDFPDETSASTQSVIKSFPESITHSTLPHLNTQEPTGAPETVTSFSSPGTASHFVILDTTRRQAHYSSTSLPDPVYKMSQNPVTPELFNTFTDQILEDVKLTQTALPYDQEKHSFQNYNVALTTTPLDSDSSNVSWTSQMSTSADPVLTINSTLDERYDYTISNGLEVTESSPNMTTPALIDILTSVTAHVPNHYTEGNTYPHLKEEATGTSLTPQYNQSSSHGGDKLLRSHWEVGNWSECSTSCGLGAMWRTVLCKEDDKGTCDINTKPAPARRCYLRPCASWTVGNWSKCSSSCGTGVRVRDVQCLDMRDKRKLRPFHCQSTVYKPRIQVVCNEKKCMEWYVSSWRECSEECGGGMQQRLVTCPQTGRCDESLKPNSTRSCNDHPCTTWAVGPWGQCTASCGGGIQRRQVKCVNKRTEAAEEDNNLCDHEPWPENLQKCNPQDCQQNNASLQCTRDRLTFSFCRTLRILGRCSLATVQAQCCQTCQSHIQSSRDLSNQRVSRR
ncbi:A disintegrin and metalloproteinase with thrombospondin motifs 7-like isoform X1 [Bufo gargarizans]|uniref:A disintegrin and metalloproteinase with thrombospondin motifs 7-like isoform X1 n=2 Tax=Bufo gargarizans TaxID=30331 RepID=UPI001CF581EA|nr:A disintegrin and metalloproteinase with thrombospondin motifs 7-like isoform X1 [Bufo gargarizans]